MYRFIVMMLSAAALLSGCGAPTRVINGEVVEVLSPREELEMISIARATLAKSRRLSYADRKFIRENDPVLKIRYTSNRTGDATISWKVSGRRITLLMRGTFFTPSVQWVMKINNDHPEFTDFSSKGKIRVEKN